jgi:hypothetical protein
MSNPRNEDKPPPKSSMKKANFFPSLDLHKTTSFNPTISTTSIFQRTPDTCFYSRKTENSMLFSLPIVIAIYPHQSTNDDPSDSSRQCYNGFMAANPDNQIFIDAMSDANFKTRRGREFISKTKDHYFLENPQENTQICAWTDFILIYHISDIQLIKNYQRINNLTFRSDEPTFYTCNLGDENDVTLEPWDGHKRSLSHTYFPGDRLSIIFKNLLVRIGKISLTLSMPLLSLPVLVAIYPHQSTAGSQFYHGFMSASPNNQIFIDIISADSETPHAREFISENNDHYFLSNSDANASWVDFIFLYDENNIPRNFRTEEPAFFMFELTELNNVTFKAWDGKESLSLFFFPSKLISTLIKNLLFEIGKVSLALAINHTVEAVQEKKSPSLG